MLYKMKKRDLPPVHLPALQADVSCVRMADCYGMWVMESQDILLHEDNGPDLMRSTVLHEVVHAALENSGVPVEEHSEVFVNGLSTQLLFFIQNNPDWVAYLMDRSLPLPVVEGEEDDPEDDPEPDPPDTESNVIALHPKGKEGKKDRAGQDSAPKARASAAKGGKRGKRTGRRRR